MFPLSFQTFHISETLNGLNSREKNSWRLITIYLNRNCCSDPFSSIRKVKLGLLSQLFLSISLTAKLFPPEPFLTYELNLINLILLCFVYLHYFLTIFFSSKVALFWTLPDLSHLKENKREERFIKSPFSLFVQHPEIPNLPMPIC